jgi:hypothetical protein
MFRSLGDVVHLLEDMGQPQHTRNDSHSAINNPEKQAFEDYTNDRVLGVNDESNPYVRGFFGSWPVKFSAPPLGTYPVPMFATPVRFFTTRSQDGNDSQRLRAGLADYTNRGFFTGGTLPETTSEPLPPHPLDTSYGVDVVNCPELADHPKLDAVTCTHYTHVVPDEVAQNPNYADELPCYQNKDGTQYCYSEPPLVSESVFRQPVTILNPDAQGSEQWKYVPETALGIAELDTIGNMTIPRAVAYATGMLNYFFRGQLKLSSPPDGLYGVIDQGTPHRILDDGIPVLSSDGVTTFGFTSLRVRVKNDTMVDANGNPTLIDAGTKLPSGQIMTGGRGPDGQPNGYLVAIAHYHRNPCYQTDLSGEASFQPPADLSAAHVPAGCSTGEDLRTAVPEISVSAPVWLDEYGSLPGPNPNDPQAGPCDNVGNINEGATDACANASALMKFDFSGDPIPVNATDLFLQVAYRGQLGQETDGIAVGMIDLMEPAYYTAAASADWIWDAPNEQFVPSSAQYRADNVVNYLSMCVGQQKVGMLNPQQTLGATEIARLGILTDQTSSPFQTATVSKKVGDSSPSVIRVYNGLSLVRQSDRENGGNYSISPMIYGRGTTFTTLAVLGTSFPQGSEAAWTAYFALTPALGASSPGIATPIAAQFTGAADAECSQYNPAQSAAHSSSMLDARTTGAGATGYGAAEPGSPSLQ